MTTWEAVVGATTYSLSNGNPFWRLQATGLGMPPIRSIKQRGPFQDGSTRRDFRLDDRPLNLVLFFQAASLAQADSYRDLAVEIFKPLTNTPVKIRATRDDGAVRQLDTYAVGTMDLPDTEQDRFVTFQRILVQMEAPDPIWYDPTLNNLGFETVVGGTEGFQIPMMAPWDQQPGDIIDATQTVNYTGNWREHPVIVITGPATNPLIRNVTTGEEIEFSGTIGVGDTRTIDLRYGTKTVRDGNGALKNSELTSGSALGTWHLAPAPEAADGVNEIRVQILSGGTTATRVSMQFYNRYLHL